MKPNNHLRYITRCQNCLCKWLALTEGHKDCPICGQVTYSVKNLNTMILMAIYRKYFYR